MRGEVSTRLSWFVAEEGNPISTTRGFILFFYFFINFNVYTELYPEFLIHGTVFRPHFNHHSFCFPADLITMTLLKQHVALWFYVCLGNIEEVMIVNIFNMSIWKTVDRAKNKKTKNKSKFKKYRSYSCLLQEASCSPVNPANTNHLDLHELC